jgi:VanZ family protein
VLHLLFRPHPRLAWLATALWAGTIFYLSSLTGREIERIAPFDFWDKAMHFSAYAAGGVLLGAALRWSFPAWSWKKIALLGAAALSLYGVSDEIHQTFTPFRSADVSDWIADTLGGFAGLKLFQFLHARTQPAHSPAPPGA